MTLCKTLDDVLDWQDGQEDYESLPPGSVQIDGPEEEPVVRLVSGLVVKWDNCFDTWCSVHGKY